MVYSALNLYNFFSDAFTYETHFGKIFLIFSDLSDLSFNRFQWVTTFMKSNTLKWYVTSVMLLFEDARLKQYQAINKCIIRWYILTCPKFLQYMPS